jgi:hypothetical protein
VGVVSYRVYFPYMLVANSVKCVLDGSNRSELDQFQSIFGKIDIDPHHVAHIGWWSGYDRGNIVAVPKPSTALLHEFVLAGVR